VRHGSSFFNLKHPVISLRSFSSYPRRCPPFLVLLSFLQKRVLQGSYYAKCNQYI
jgi:hypothetical protein